MRGQPVRGRIERQRGTPRPVVKAAIAQQRLIRARELTGRDASTGTTEAADLEQIGKVAVEHDTDLKIYGMVAEVAHAKALIGRSFPQEDGAHDVQRVLLQDEALAFIDIRIGQVDRVELIVVALVRAKQQRLLFVHEQLKARQKPRVMMKQPIRSAGQRADIAVAVDHEEGVITFERAPKPARGAGGGNIKRRFGIRRFGTRIGRNKLRCGDGRSHRFFS